MENGHNAEITETNHIFNLFFYILKSVFFFNRYVFIKQSFICIIKNISEKLIIMLTIPGKSSLFLTALNIQKVIQLLSI